ncbi:MAG: MoaD family protein [Candidatus Bipolaricaulota bacterium]
MNDGSTPSTESSIRLDVRVFGGLRELLGSRSLEVRLPGRSTVAALLDSLERDHRELVAALRRGIGEGYLNVLVNGHNAHFRQGLATALSDGDAVAFLPPIGGG